MRWCCRMLMLTKYQLRVVLLVTRVKPSSVELLRGEAIVVGWWTINWDCFSSDYVCKCVRVWAMETIRNPSNNRTSTSINLTNKSLFIGWPDENEPFPTPFVKLLLNCDEYVVDVIARLDDDFWTVCAWITWRAPPFDVIVCKMFICLCCEWIPSDVWIFCETLYDGERRKWKTLKRDHAVRETCKTRTRWRLDFQKRRFREEFQVVLDGWEEERGETWIHFGLLLQSSFWMKLILVSSTLFSAIRLS